MPWVFGHENQETMVFTVFVCNENPETMVFTMVLTMVVHVIAMGFYYEIGGFPEKWWFGLGLGKS